MWRKVVGAWNLTRFRTSSLNLRCISSSSVRNSNKVTKDGNEFDEKMLEYLVCPLSKKPLRFDREKNELICDEIGVVYSIINGIPNLVPQDAKMIKNNQPINIINTNDKS